MGNAGQSVQAQVSIQAGGEESRCWSLRCFQLWDRNLLLETNCSTFCFPQTSCLCLWQKWFPTVLAELSNELDPIFSPGLVLNLYPLKEVSRWCNPHTGVWLAESLDFWRDPCRWFPSCPLNWGQLLLVRFGAAPKVHFRGSALCSCQGSRAAEAHVYFHTDGKPFLQRHWTLQILTWVLKFWFCTSPWCWDVLAQSTVGLWSGFAAVILSNSESLLGFFQQAFSSLVSLTAFITHC